MENFNRQRRYERRKSAEAADIGVIPPVANSERRESCRVDLLRFLVTYFPASTGLKPFSEDHRRVIDRLQRCILEGGRFVNAVYRGFAKTTMSENAAIWAVLYGHRRFVAVFGSGSKEAGGNIDSIKTELAENELLYEDFPEVCHPIKSLEGRPQRCGSQSFTITGDCDCGGDGDCTRCKGTGTAKDSRLTHIEWTADTIVLPTIPGSVAAGAILTCRGITAASRGMKHKRPDGTQQRPDMALIDDPQTDESARTPLQVAKRMSIIKKSILKLGGHSYQIAAVVNATVIQVDDMIDQLLNPKMNASWQGERIGMVKAWSKAHDTLWMGEYARFRTTYDADDPGSQRIARAEATKFYIANREKMDEGAKVSWEWCYNWNDGTEISATQHAYNSLIDDGEEVFASEYQNQPKRSEQEGEQLKPAVVEAKAVRLKRGVIPAYVTHLTAFIDVQDKLLYGGVVGWGPGFRGHVVDYRTFPDQKRPHFALRDIKVPFTNQFAHLGKEGALRAALEAFTEELLGKSYQSEAGPEVSVNLCLIDAGDGGHAGIVYEFCLRSKFKTILRPSKGRYIGAKQTPWESFPQRPGEQLGHHWLLAPLAKGRATRLFQLDTNYWKTFASAGISAGVGDIRSIELFEGKHPMFADHATSEFSQKTAGNGRELNEWTLRTNRENHYWDVLVGNCAAASAVGVKINIGMPAVKRAKPRRKAKVSLI